MLSSSPLAKETIEVIGHKMAFHARGEGPAILLLHGNPTSLYLWRNVLPPLDGLGRLIAPDLIGMGDSEKLARPDPDTYNYATHRRFIWAFIESVLRPDELIIFVTHDWGSALAFDWAFHHQDRVAGVAYMEAIVRPFADWSDWGPTAETFKRLRSMEGETMVLRDNVFVEKLLFGSNIRWLNDDEKAEYRRPFEKPLYRWPTLLWPRQIPVGGEPPTVVKIVEDYAAWLPTSKFPKLFVNAEPGAILVGAAREFCRSWNKQTEIAVPGVHFVQEDSGPVIGQEIARWIRACRLN